MRWTPPRAAHGARLLARFHAKAATGEGVDAWGGIAAIGANWEENFAQTAPFIGRTIPAAHYERITTFVAETMAARAPLVAERVAAGRIRDGRRDLHSANICVEGRTLHLFDCLEFSPRYRCADVAAEVAFLAMDLDRYGRADLAAAFVAAYVRASGDGQLLDLLPFYRSYRAYVRGKVLSLGLEDPALTPDARAESTRQARRYFDLAWSHAGGIAHPVLIVTMGGRDGGRLTSRMPLPPPRLRPSLIGSGAEGSRRASRRRRSRRGCAGASVARRCIAAPTRRCTGARVAGCAPGSRSCWTPHAGDPAAGGGRAAGTTDSCAPRRLRL